MSAGRAVLLSLTLFYQLPGRRALQTSGSQTVVDIRITQEPGKITRPRPCLTWTKRPLHQLSRQFWHKPENHCYGPNTTLFHFIGCNPTCVAVILCFLSGMWNRTCYRISNFKRLWVVWSWITQSGKIQFYISFHVGYLAPDLCVWFIALIFFEVAFWATNILLKSALMNARCGIK